MADRQVASHALQAPEVVAMTTDATRALTRAPTQDHHVATDASTDGLRMELTSVKTYLLSVLLFVLILSAVAMVLVTEAVLV